MNDYYQKYETQSDLEDMDTLYSKLGIDIGDIKNVEKFKKKIQSFWYEKHRSLKKSTAKETVSQILRSSAVKTAKCRRRILSSKKTPSSSGKVAKRKPRTFASPQATHASDTAIPRSILIRKKVKDVKV